MKKFFILSSILISLPALAACPIDLEEGAACSIAEFSQKPFTSTYSPAGNIHEFSGTPEARLKPAESVQPAQQLRSFGPSSTDYSYNSSCQFGVCSNTGTPQLFEGQSQKQTKSGS